MLASALDLLERYDEPMATYDDADQLGRVLEDATNRALALQGKARISIARGRQAEAVEGLWLARKLLEPLGVGVAYVFGDLALAEALHLSGERDEAVALFGETEQRIAALGCAPDAELHVETERVRAILRTPR